MSRWPDARRQEFAMVVQAAGLRKGERVVDIPSGGGYLRRYLPEGVDLISIESSSEFFRAGGHPVLVEQLDVLPLADGIADCVISLAGLHHVRDKLSLFIELRRILRPAGRLVIADVQAGSNIAAFLDEFVGAHNVTGHHGWYLDDALRAQLQSAGFDSIQNSFREYSWAFVDEQEAASFCTVLFGLTAVTSRKVIDAFNVYMGTKQSQGAFLVNWGLSLWVAV